MECIHSPAQIDTSLYAHTHIVPSYISLNCLCSSLLLCHNVSFIRSISPSVFPTISHADMRRCKHTHTHTSFCYWHAKSCRKHKGIFFSLLLLRFLIPGQKQQNAITWDKSADIWRWGWHSGRLLGLQLKWTEAADWEKARLPTQIDRQTLLYFLSNKIIPLHGLFSLC